MPGWRGANFFSLWLQFCPTDSVGDDAPPRSVSLSLGGHTERALSSACELVSSIQGAALCVCELQASEISHRST